MPKGELLPPRVLAHLKHGHSRRMPGGAKATPTYSSWGSMHSRCRLDGRDNASRYRDRGIKVCDRWSDFSLFLFDMGERTPGTTLDRINGDLDYSPENCRWSSPIDQARNTRRSILTLETATQVAVMRLRGVKCKDIAKKFGISESLPREIVKGRCWGDALLIAQKLIGSER